MSDDKIVKVDFGGNVVSKNPVLALQQLAEDIAGEAADGEVVLVIRVTNNRQRVRVYEFGPELSPLERLGLMWKTMRVFGG